MKNNTSLGALLTMLAMLCFASMDAVSKSLVVDYSVGQLMWVRYFLLCFFAWFLVRKQGVRAALRSNKPGLQIFRSVVAVFEGAMFVLAFRYLPLADTHAVAATSPLIVIALGVLFMGERAGTARWLAVAAGFVGVLLIVRPGFRTLDWPLLLPLAGALLWAGYQLLTRLNARYDQPSTSLLWSAVVAFIATSFVGPLDWKWPTAMAWVMMIAVAFIGAIAHYALIKALDHAEAGAVQPYSYTLLVWAAVMGWLVFGDIPDHWTIIGATVVVASGLYTWHHNRRAAAGPTPSP
ncbi:MAG: DMT family transporter [Reyranella sp.]|uniref:DMT family transporter n=1 Tax=Reyranella sp. TaxID=1929291 RepID=UPI001ACDE52B|nr:DMT family transporter [Reyranella sp.]MBN9085909.1 DMT family transporter [Reyranella sp.]